jgi:hypothetical protein
VWIVAVSYLLFVGLLGYVAHEKRAAFASLSLDNAGSFAWVVLLALLITVLRGVMNQVSFSLEQRISLVAGVRLAVVNTLGNYLPMSGGLIAKGVLLARHYGIGYMFYAGVSVYTFLLAISANGLLGIIGALVTGQHPLLVGLLALALLAGAFTLVPIPVRLRGLRKGLGDKLEYARTHFSAVRVPLAVITLAIFAIAALRLELAFAVLGVEVAFFASMLINSVTIFSRLATFVPGGIGIREFLVATMAHLTGLDFQMTILVVGIDRLGEVIVSFLLGGAMVARPFRSPGASRPTRRAE